VHEAWVLVVLVLCIGAGVVAGWVIRREERAANEAALVRSADRARRLAAARSARDAARLSYLQTRDPRLDPRATPDPVTRPGNGEDREAILFADRNQPKGHWN
jgi:hypothetical protein